MYILLNHRAGQRYERENAQSTKLIYQIGGGLALYDASYDLNLLYRRGSETADTVPYPLRLLHKNTKKHVGGSMRSRSIEKAFHLDGVLDGGEEC